VSLNRHGAAARVSRAPASNENPVRQTKKKRAESSGDFGCGAFSIKFPSRHRSVTKLL